MIDLLDSIQDQELKQYLSEVARANNKIRGDGTALTIGVMGKSGAGKSSLINTLCQSNLCKSGAASGCTRAVQLIPTKIAEMNACLIDFPGIAENGEWDKSYVDLYHSYLDQLDVILWVIKIDDRAVLEDENFFNTYLSNTEIKDKCIFILSQADKAAPSREWDRVAYQPSEKQKENINRNKYRIFSNFDIEGVNVVAISTDYHNGSFKNYNFEDIFDLILFRLNNDSKIAEEISLESSWGCTKREMTKSREWTSCAFQFLGEDAAELSKKAADLENELRDMLEEDEKEESVASFSPFFPFAFKENKLKAKEDTKAHIEEHSIRSLFDFLWGDNPKKK